MYFMFTQARLVGWLRINHFHKWSREFDDYGQGLVVDL